MVDPTLGYYVPRVFAPQSSQDSLNIFTSPSQEDMQPITEGERGRRPSPPDKKARFRLELALSREPDEDVCVSCEVSGSYPLLMQAVAPQGGEHREQRLMPPFGSKPGHNLELAPAREQGPENLAGRCGAVLPVANVEEQLHNNANQHETFQVHSQHMACSIKYFRAAAILKTVGAE